MAAAPVSVPGPLSPLEQLRLARQIVRTEGQTLRGPGRTTGR